MTIQSHATPLQATPSQNDESTKTVNLASWVQEPHSKFLQAYTAATDNQKSQAILSFLNPEDAACVNVSKESHGSDILHTFLTYPDSGPRLHTLEKLLLHTYPSGLKDPISVHTSRGAITLITDSPLGLLVYLLPALTYSPIGLLEKSKAIREAKRLAEQANKKYLRLLGQELTPEIKGKNILPFAATMVSSPSYTNRKDKRKLDPEMKFAMAKLKEFSDTDFHDIYVSSLNRLQAIREAREDKQYLSNGSRPSQSLIRIRSVTFALLNILDSEALINTPGVYSLIAYLVGLSPGIQSGSDELPSVSSVKQRVNAAIKIWTENKPSDVTNFLDSQPVHF